MEYMTQNNIVYFLLVVGIFYLIYGYIFGGGIKAMTARHASGIKTLFSKSRK